MNIDKKTAKAQFTIEKHRDSYEIKAFANVSFRTGSPSKGSGYEYYFYSDQTPREIIIPDEIDGFPVTKVAVKCIPDDAIVFCRADLFPKLTRATKASTARAYLEDPARFEEEEAEQIKMFVKKYSEDTAYALCGSSCVEAYIRFLEQAKPKPEMLEKLADAANGNAEIRAVLLNQSSGTEKTEGLTFEPKKMTVSEFKKLWTYSEYTDGESGEKLIRLSNYKGADEHVVIPAALGKKRIAQIEGVFPATVTSAAFEGADIEIRCSFRNCRAMADENGFIVVHAGDRSVLTDYIGPKDAETLNIPEGVTENLPSTFHKVKCRKAVFPEGFQKLAYGSFSDCDHLQSVEFPESLKEIGQLTFSGCVSLQELYIPASVETIGYHPAGYKNIVFYGESGSAAEAYALAHGIPFREGKLPSKELNPFVIADGTLIRYVGSDAEVIIPSEVKKIDWMAFQENEIIRTLVIPEGVEQLDKFSFKGCSKLEKVTLPESLKILDSYAFSNCESLKEVVFSGQLTSIGDCAFEGCRALKSIKLPEGLAHIGEQAFSACFDLLEVHLPSSVKEIGKDAFQSIAKQQRTIIHAPAGSYAEQYAKENNIPFVAE